DGGSWRAEKRGGWLDEKEALNVLDADSTIVECSEYMLLTRAYLKLGDDAEGRFYLNQAAKLVRAEPYEDAATNAALFSMLAELYMLDHNFQTAKALYYTYMRRIEALYGTSHIATSDCYNVLAAFFTHRGEYGTALEYCTKALIIRMEQLGENHAVTADSHFNMGLLYRLHGRPKDAKREFSIARDIRKTLFGPAGLEVAEVELSLGFTEFQLGNLQAAHRLCERVQVVRQSALGRRHPDTLEAVNMLDTVRVAQGMPKTGDDIALPPQQRLGRDEGIGIDDLPVPRFDQFLLQRSLSRMDRRGGQGSGAFGSRVLQAARSQGALSAFEIRDRFGSRFPEQVDLLLQQLDEADLEQRYPPSPARLRGASHDDGRAGGFESKFPDVDSSAGMSSNRNTVAAERSVFRSAAGSSRASAARESSNSAERPRRFLHLGGSLGDVDGKTDELSYPFPVSPLVAGTDRARKHLSGASSNTGGSTVAGSSTGDFSHGPSERERPGDPIESWRYTMDVKQAQLRSSSSTFGGGSNKPAQGHDDRDGRGPGNGVGSSGGTGVGKAGSGGRNASGGGSSSGQIVGDPALGNRRSKVVALSGEELWKAFDVEVFCGFALFPTLLERKKREDEAKERERARQDAAKNPKKGNDAAKPNPAKLQIEQQEAGKKRKKKKPRGPKSDTKRVHWDVLEDTEGTIWDSGVDSSDIEISEVFGDLKDEFSSKQPDKALGEKKASSGSTKREEVVLVPDPKRRQNMSIFVKTLMKGGRSLAVVGDALRSMDMSNFGTVALDSLDEFLPQGDETDAVQAFVDGGGDVSLLGPAEAFVHTLADVPRLRQRIKTLAVLAEFDELAQDVRSRALLIERTCSHIQDSSRFARLLSIILKVGNELNKGTQKEDAQGVRLSSLVKLSQTKSNQNTTLLEYIVRHLEDKEPRVLDIADDFPDLADASRCSMQLLTSDLAKLKSGFALVENACQGAVKADDDPDFVKAVEPFLQRARPVVGGIEEDF
ncbi:Delphilin (Glutamate receptor, partial [Durusdinium trenchii]